MSKYRRLSGTDAMFVYMESPRAYQHTLKIAVLDPSSDPLGWCWERFQQHVRNTIHKAPLWRQRCMKTPLALNYPVWVDDPEFDLDYPVRRIGCPAPGGKEEFSQLISDLYSRVLDPDRPLWQMWVIEGLEMPPSHKDPSIPKAFSYRLDSSQRQFNCRSFQLADIRRAAKAFDRTINDVFTSCVAGALRRYLAETGQAVDRPTLASMPMNTVPLEQRTAMGNFATAERLSLRIDIEDPLERLQATAEACEVTKQHFRNTREADLRALFNLLHPAVMKFVDWLNERRGGNVFPISNITLSNVPGPRKERYVQGWKVMEWFSTGQVGHGVALNLTVWSYAQQFNLCVLSDRSVPADNALLLDYFGASLNELLDLARPETTEILIAPDISVSTRTGCVENRCAGIGFLLPGQQFAVQCAE